MLFKELPEHFETPPTIFEFDIAEGELQIIVQLIRFPITLVVWHS
jgi:hypothetical protein